jgi:hypothetical protein
MAYKFTCYLLNCYMPLVPFQYVLMHIATFCEPDLVHTQNENQCLGYVQDLDGQLPKPHKGYVVTVCTPSTI